MAEKLHPGDWIAGPFWEGPVAETRQDFSEQLDQPTQFYLLWRWGYGEWERDRQEDLAALIAARGGELWPVPQAVVELLSRNSAERTALMSLLGTRGDLEMRAQRWAERHPRAEARVEVVQGMLWGDEG